MFSGVFSVDTCTGITHKTGHPFSAMAATAFTVSGSWFMEITT